MPNISAKLDWNQSCPGNELCILTFTQQVLPLRYERGSFARPVVLICERFVPNFLQILPKRIKAGTRMVVLYIQAASVSYPLR